MGLGRRPVTILDAPSTSASHLSDWAMFQARSDVMEVRPYTVNMPQVVLDDLHERLAHTRWPDEIPATGWEYGADLRYMTDLVEYWQTHFDWRAQERTINTFAHFRATVDGVGIHFIHEKGRGPAPIPIIITHGWPGSFVEMLRLIPLLTDPGSHGAYPRDAFDVVVPSLPGFGFSDRPTQPGMSNFRIADLWATLMNGLGYPRYGVQGGDWGASVATDCRSRCRENEASARVGLKHG